MNVHPRLPKPFNGQLTKYRKFRQSVRLYLAAHKGPMDDKSKILFILSYMGEGLAGMWVENYMDDHFDGDQFNGGTYSDFIKELDEAFSDPALDRDAQATLNTIQQGGRPAREFFIEVDRLWQDAGWSNDSYYVNTLFPRALNNRLRKSHEYCWGIQKSPTTYQGWKAWAIQRDDSYWQCLAGTTMGRDESSEKETSREGSIVEGEGVTDGGMDFAEMRRQGLCFSCGKHGHLARNCRNSL